MAGSVRVESLRGALSLKEENFIVNILIIGSLFAIGILAAIALFFVVRSEPSEESSAVEHITGTSPSRPVTPVVPEAVETPAASDMPPVLEEEVSESELHPQVYELFNELDTIRQQMQQLEQRLNRVTTALEQAQHVQNGRFSAPVDHTAHVPETPPHP